MAIDTATPNSPGWWFKGLLAELGKRQRRYNRLERYYEGDGDLPEGAEQVKDTYRRFQKKARTNFAELIVEAVRERMVPQAFRTGSDGTSGGNKTAWTIWQANSLDADAALVHRAQLVMSDAYVIVGGPDATIGGSPLITPEDPRQVITAHDPLHPRRVIAALKVFSDDVQKADFAFLYMPGFVFRLTRPRSNSSASFTFNMSGWNWVADADPNPGVLPVPVVPVVRFANRANIAGASMGEFEDVLDVLDRINHMLLQRVVIATMQAFRQRAIKGELPSRDLDGNEIDYGAMFPANPGALWRLPDGVDLWESAQVDLTPILSSVRHDVQDLAAVTRTPLFYLTPDAANGSAEGASLAREGLVFKTTDRIAQASESWEQVMRLALTFAGEPAFPDMEVVWRAVDLPSMAERFDAAAKAAIAGVPWRTIQEDILGFSPQQVDRMALERAADLLLIVPAHEKTDPAATPPGAQLSQI